MERSERRRLETIRKHLKRNLAAVEELLNTAQQPRRFSKQDARRRALAICKDVALHGKPLSDDQLRRIVQKHGVPYAAVGSLFGATYLQRSKKGIELGNRGRVIVVNKASRILAKVPDLRKTTRRMRKRP